MTVDDPVAAAARAAADRLAKQYGPHLADEVEAALHRRGQEHRPQRYFDPVELGSLIVSTASLAWTVYSSLKEKAAKPAAEVVIRAVRVEIRNHHKDSPDDEVTAIVVDEIIRTDETSGLAKHHK
jgi:hypothetical protein